nr:hypothetical protein [Tanacetum cinerariifolium]
MDDFNSATTHGYRTRHMLTGKWTRINADCQKFNAIYKHLQRKSGENEANHIEAAKVTFAAQQAKGRKFQLEHAWRILKGHSKWDAPKPLDTEDHNEIFGPDAGTSAYEAKKEKEVALMEFKEMEFLTIDADSLLEPKASIIRKRQEKIIAKYAQQSSFVSGQELPPLIYIRNNMLCHGVPNRRISYTINDTNETIQRTQYPNGHGYKVRLEGYKVRLEGIKGRDTRLLFGTTRILLRRLLVDRNLKGVTHVIIDEIHEQLKLPGLTGGSEDLYIRHMLSRARNKGWRVVVFISHGCAHSLVTTPQESDSCLLSEFSKEMSDGYNIPVTARCKSIKEFNEGLTRVSFGFKSVDDYYSKSGSAESIKHLRKTLLCIQAATDSIAPAKGIPRQDIKENPNCGHLGWVAGDEAPNGTPWTDPMVMDYR